MFSFTPRLTSLKLINCQKYQKSTNRWMNLRELRKSKNVSSCFCYCWYDSQIMNQFLVVFFYLVKFLKINQQMLKFYITFDWCVPSMYLFSYSEITGLMIINETSSSNIKGHLTNKNWIFLLISLVHSSFHSLAIFVTCNSSKIYFVCLWTFRQSASFNANSKNVRTF